MTINHQDIDSELLSLPMEERARLIEVLISSLDESCETQDNEKIEAAWLAEADRRYQEYRQGKMGAKSASDALAEARAMFRR